MSLQEVAQSAQRLIKSLSKRAELKTEFLQRVLPDVNQTKELRSQHAEELNAAKAEQRRLRSEISALREERLDLTGSLRARDRAKDTLAKELEEARADAANARASAEKAKQELQEYKRETKAQFDVLTKEVGSLREVRTAAEEALQYLAPSRPGEPSSVSLVDRLKAAPGKLKAHLHESAVASTSQVLAIVKSNNPRMDLQRVEEGFACKDREAEALIEGVEDVSVSLVENLDLDPV